MSKMRMPVPAGAGELVGYFGYGSLVNRSTLQTGFVGAHRARLKGWRRTWLPRPDMRTDMRPEMGSTPAGSRDGLAPSLLTAHRAPGAAIDGLLVIDFAENLPHIDAREVLYHRRDISLEDLEFIDPAADLGPVGELNLHVYEARVEHPPTAGPSPILRSYLDAVMQGFLSEFGEEGLHRFITETDAFDMPIFEDRHAALYPRAVSLSEHEIRLFDVALGRRSTVVGT